MSNETILIIDDNPEIARFVKILLASSNYRLLAAYDGKHGLEMALTQNPDLVMLDMNLPKLNGMEVLKALREAGNQAPVIFMTVFGSETIAVSAFRLGVTDYLSKPFEIDDAIQAIENALQRVRSERERLALERKVLAAETVRQTVATLAHYINNSLTALNGSLELMAEEMHSSGVKNAHLAQLLRQSHEGARRIGMVLKVLRRMSDVNTLNYSEIDQANMLDIERELARMLQSPNGDIPTRPLRQPGPPR